MEINLPNISLSTINGCYKESCALGHSFMTWLVKHALLQGVLSPQTLLSVTVYK